MVLGLKLRDCPGARITEAKIHMHAVPQCRPCILFLGLLLQSTTHQGLKTTEMYCLTVLEASSPVWAAPRSLCRGESFLVCLASRGGQQYLVPWLATAHSIPASAVTWPSPYVCVMWSSPPGVSPLKRTPAIPQHDLVLTDYICRHPVSESGHNRKYCG